MMLLYRLDTIVLRFLTSSGIFAYSAPCFFIVALAYYAICLYIEDISLILSRPSPVFHSLYSFQVTAFSFSVSSENFFPYLFSAYNGKVVVVNLPLKSVVISNKASATNS
nr:MAG TPA: hypothetical protein [Caudoviricetes sp.]